jgi:hypothetical protein
MNFSLRSSTTVVDNNHLQHPLLNSQLRLVLQVCAEQQQDDDGSVGLETVQTGRQLAAQTSNNVAFHQTVRVQIQGAAALLPSTITQAQVQCAAAGCWTV